MYSCDSASASISSQRKVEVVTAVTTVSGIKSVLNLPAAWEGILSCCRKRYLKHGAGFSVIRADRPSMQMNDLLRQGKADAGFSAPPHVEAIKDVGDIFLGDAVPVVLYPDGHMMLVRAAGQAQLAAGIAYAVR